MFKDPKNWSLPCSQPRNRGDKVGWLMTSSQEQIQHYSYHVVKKQSLCSLGKNYKIIKYFCWAKLVLYKVPFLHHFVLEVWLSQIIVELAECSPIIIQNSSNPLSQKNLDVWPYNCTTAQGATFNMRGVLCHGPQLCSVVQWLVHWTPKWTTWVLVLAGARHCALETCGGKKCKLRL